MIPELMLLVESQKQFLQFITKVEAEYNNYCLRPDANKLYMNIKENEINKMILFNNQVCDFINSVNIEEIRSLKSKINDLEFQNKLFEKTLICRGVNTGELIRYSNKKDFHI